MKILSQKTTSLIIAIVTLYVGFASTGCAEEMYDTPEQISALYDPDALEQSILYQFLHSCLFIQTMEGPVKKFNACDYCKLRDQFSFKFRDDFPDFLKELDLSPYPSDNKNCKLCALFDMFTFSDLFAKLYDKLTGLQKKEKNSLRKLDSKVAEELEHFFESRAEENPINAMEKLYNKIKKKGNFPNTLDAIMLKKNVLSDLIIFMRGLKEIPKHSIELHMNLQFAKTLAMHKKFLADNSDILFQIQEIANMDFQNIKTLPEIMHRIEEMQNELKLPDSAWEKDLL